MSVPCEKYQRYLEPGFTPFDPLELARQTEKIVCRGDSRKYTKFYCTGVYGGIATGYTCGCCLRCIFCWVNWSRDFPEKYGTFRAPAEAFHQLSRVARKARVSQLRISGAEPTLSTSHLLALINMVKGNSGAVRVYLGALSKTFFDAEWANNYLTHLQSDPNFATDDRIQELRNLMVEKDGPFGDYSPEDILLALLEKNRQNRMAIEYLMAWTWTPAIGRNIPSAPTKKPGATPSLISSYSFDRTDATISIMF